ncbi:hypothetical protein [Gorillibacterium sp. sgz5001074]|uniref:hypothetical protein n=1 Tax=Gorillibacterium sp. sgz5001074 TaxID=3446695 RepID=UPI003F677043
MSSSKRVWIPSLLLLLAAAGLCSYSFLLPEARHVHSSLKEAMTTLGTAAVFLGALSFLWIRFKSLRRSESILLKKLSKLLRSVHQASGYAALALILAHGVYFLFYTSLQPGTLSGLAAFTVLAALAGYGMLMKRIRNVHMRTIHRTLSIAWIPFLLIHAGGSVILSALLSAAICGAAWLVERRTLQSR